ncbi:MAG: hemolysin D [Pirellulales bacterium]|nr:hemolysin D [Pirellulales bacterium]
MATLADSLVSSASRPLPIQVRADLTARKQRYHGQVYWVVKEPVGLNYFRFEEEEFAILNMLDGHSSLDEIAKRFEAEFPPQTIRVEELQQFIGTLHKSGLVVTAAPGQGVQLCKRRDEKRRRELLGSMTNVLAVRFKGFDPERVLNRLYPYTRWFFSKPMLILNICLALMALLLVVVQFDVFRSRLPSFESFFAAKNWLWLGLVLAITKVIHEFGHGLTCKHFGGECHEMGVMLLVLTPCLYCNVSDSWMLPNRWHRAAIGAAGMYVEIVIAAIATFLWWFSEPGPLNYICLNIMFISSVSTILFNANPLLRYDGYYILADVLEIPNLRQKATTILTRKLGAWCLGLEEPDDPFLPKRHQWLFVLYTIAAIFYRWFIVLSILFFLNKVFEPYGLKVLGQAIALVAIYGLFLQPLWKIYKFFSIPGRLGKVKRKRMVASLGLLICLVAAVLFIPLPASVYCPLVVQPRGAEPVYVEVAGVLADVQVQPGDYVQKNQLLAELKNYDIEIQIAKQQGILGSYEADLNVAYRLAHQDDATARRLPASRAAYNTAVEQLAQLEADREKLRLVAPCDGYVIPPPLAGEPPPASGELPQWSGTPFDKKNEGATLVPGERGLFCWIGDPEKLEAHLVIDQADIEFVDIGQNVEINLFQNSDRGIILTSTIAEIAPEELKSSPKHLASHSGGPLATEIDPSGVPRPLNTSYQATVPIENLDGAFRVGLTGTAKIQIPPRTLANRLWRYLRATFSFKL